MAKKTYSVVLRMKIGERYFNHTEYWNGERFAEFSDIEHFTTKKEAMKAVSKGKRQLSKSPYDWEISIEEDEYM